MVVIFDLFALGDAVAEAPKAKHHNHHDGRVYWFRVFIRNGCLRRQLSSQSLSSNSNEVANMARSSAPIRPILSVSIFLLITLGCGSIHRQLQSIATDGVGMIQFQFTAVGSFDMSPTTVNSLPVSWYLVSQSPPPANYTLTSQPFVTQCQTFAVVIAVAPSNPNAPSSGTIPSHVFQDLVIAHTTTSEGGFVASSPQNIACP
jgi:hypothetical protein